MKRPARRHLIRLVAVLPEWLRLPRSPAGRSRMGSLLRVGIFVSILFSFAFGGIVLGTERFPPPDFSDHQLPETLVPDSHPPLHSLLNLGVLALVLALASYLAVFRRSRRGLFVLSIFSVLWLGFLHGGCICPIGSIQNVALAIGDSSYTIPVTVAILFLMPIIVTLFFGRTFCAAVCPLGAFQELIALKPVRVPAWLDQTLGLFTYIYLGLAVLFASTGTAFLICRYDPFVGFFRLNASISMVLLGVCFFLVGIFVGRPYCRYLCPYGAILGVFSRFSQWHVQIPPKQCINCRLCEDACPYGAIREPTVPQSTEVRRTSRNRFAGLLLALPMLVGLGYYFGGFLETPLARVHPKVRLAEIVRTEQTQKSLGSIEAPEPSYDTYAANALHAFRNSGRSVKELFQEALALRKWFNVAGAWFGAYVGLVIGLKLLHLSIRRQRLDYQPDQSTCVSCGRCFWYCPIECNTTKEPTPPDNPIELGSNAPNSR